MLQRRSPTRLLIVEDNPNDAQLLKRTLQATFQGSLETEWTETIADAKRVLATESFDLVLLDLWLPDSDGFETLRQVQCVKPDVPVVVVTDLDDEELAIDLVRAGAQDCVSKDQITEQLLFRTIRHSIARQQQLNHCQAAARTDGLTGIPNRAAFDTELQRQLASHKRHGTAVTVVLLDIDHFKQFNDNHGHLAGDRVLRDVADVLRGSVRESDIVTRFGGEEFGILLPLTGLSAARLIAERIRLDVMAHVCGFEDQELHVTLSAGLTEVTADDTIESVIARADKALYEAKRAGRNCCYANDRGTNNYIDAMQIALDRGNVGGDPAVNEKEATCAVSSPRSRLEGRRGERMPVR